MMACSVVLLASCSAPVLAPTYTVPWFSLRQHPVVGILGDTQRTSILEVWRERNDPQRERLLRQFAQQRPDVMIHLGDMVFYGSDHDDWDYFDRVMEPARRAGISVLPILGNHEYFGVDRVMQEHVRLRFGDAPLGWSSTVIDSVAFVLLNTNYREIGLEAMEQQRRWYVRTMRDFEVADSVVFIVVCGHHPPYTNSTVVDDDALLQQYFLPVYMTSRKSAVWFSGHAHAYEHFYINMKHFVVSGGGGGPRQRLLAGDGEEHIDMYQPAEDAVLRPFHYCTVERTDRTLHVVMHPLQMPGIIPAPADSFAVAVSGTDTGTDTGAGR